MELKNIPRNLADVTSLMGIFDMVMLGALACDLLVFENMMLTVLSMFICRPHFCDHMAILFIIFTTVLLSSLYEVG